MSRRYIAVLLALLGFFPFWAYARGNSHRSHMPTPVAPAPPPVATTTPATGFSFGTYNNQKPTAAGMLTEYFTDGDFIGGNNSVIFLEPPYNDSSILAGKFDTTLQELATAASKYSNVILVLGEEENCVGSDDSWSVGYDGNTLASSITTIQHEATLARKYDPSIKIAQDWNADDCGGSTPLTSYYAGSSYIDIIMDDGFDFGGSQKQTWDQVFDTSLSQLGTLGKPLWIGSEGVVSSDNQTAFIQATIAGVKTYKLSGVMYFIQSPFILSSAALSLFKTL